MSEVEKLKARIKELEEAINSNQHIQSSLASYDRVKKVIEAGGYVNGYDAAAAAYVSVSTMNRLMLRHPSLRELLNENRKEAKRKKYQGRVDAVNRRRSAGMGVVEACRDAGTSEKAYRSAKDYLTGQSC